MRWLRVMFCREGFSLQNCLLIWDYIVQDFRRVNSFYLAIFQYLRQRIM